MPKVTKHKARNNIYRNGIKVKSDKTKSGERRDHSQPADEKDTLLVAKGQDYYTWQFKNSPRQYSLKSPTRQQLTQSDYLISVYDLQDRIDEISAEDAETLQSLVEDIKSEIESLRDEQEEKRSNMPEHLQDVGSGETLQERYNALDEAVSALDGIDLEFEDPDIDDLLEELGWSEEDETEKPSDEEIEEKRQEKLQEWLDEKISEIQEISLEG